MSDIKLSDLVSPIEIDAKAGPIVTRADLEREILKHVERRCLATAMPVPLRILSGMFSMPVRRLGLLIADVVGGLHNEGKCLLWNPRIKAGRAVFSLSLAESCMSNAEQDVKQAYAKAPLSYGTYDVRERFHTYLDSASLKAKTKQAPQVLADMPEVRPLVLEDELASDSKDPMRSFLATLSGEPEPTD